MNSDVQVLYERCCGLDVHKKSVTSCIITPKGKKIRTFGTMTPDIFEMVDWLKQNKCKDVAMESTGSFWRPIYNILELCELNVNVINAQHIKNVPGRKTDVKDAQWIATCFRLGLVKSSFIPDRQDRELRDLVRARNSLTRDRSTHINRIAKTLEECNIKLSSVATDINGVSGRLMLDAIADGEIDSAVLAELAKGRLKKKKNDLQRALSGIISPHQRMMIAMYRDIIKFFDEQIAQLDQEIEERMRPFEEQLQLLDTIPGVGRITAQKIIAEIGTDMSQFPSSGHLASWAGMAPGNNESAGKRKSGRTRKGNKHLKTALVEAAKSAGRTKNTYLSAQYHRLSARRGSKKATVAVGHTILVIAYHILKERQPYKELGADYFEKRKEQDIVRHAVKRIRSLGYKVSIESPEVPADSA